MTDKQLNRSLLYIRFLLAICSLFTIISGVFVYLVSNKIDVVVNPLKADIAIAEIAIKNNREILEIYIKDIKESVKKIENRMDRGP